MNWKMPLLKQGLRAVNYVGQRYYPQQKELLDELRQDDYALIIFDALRCDVAQQILPLYLDGYIEPIWSEAHDTFGYGYECWSDRKYYDHYISGATPLHADPDFDDEFFQSLYNGWNPADTMLNLVEAWSECWDSSLGTCNPEQLTELADEYTDKEQLVVHYFQPHCPYIGRFHYLGYTDDENAKPLTGEPVDKPIWERVKSGEIGKNELWNAYVSNTLRVVESALPLVKTLCEQDRRVVIMADHGELLGRIHPKLVTHPRLSFPQIRKVPWMEVKAVREYPDPDRKVDGTIAQKLEALGYK